MSKGSSELFLFDQKHRGSFFHLAGLDEAGRGCWAGPVVAAAVILPQNPVGLEGVDDSKKLSATQRENCFGKIVEQALSFGVGIVEASVIDEINILQATKQAMYLALQSLNPKADFLLVDGNMTLDVATPQQAVIEGDAKSLSIAAASILAKVTRDRLMQTLAQEHPGYGFEKHKGYGTAIHRKALQDLGVSPIHRMSYKPVALFLKPSLTNIS